VAETKRRIIIGIIIVLGLLIALSIFEPKIALKETKTVEIKSGLTTREVAFVLKENGVILEPYSFTIWAYLTGNENKIKSGIYEIKDVKNIFDLFSLLSKGGKPKEILITIPEGFTTKDIADRLYANGIVKDRDDFHKYIKPFEGYLYPDTYYFYENMSYESIVSKMKERLYELLPSNFDKLAKDKGLTTNDVIILASIVEKEAKLDEDRPIIASVFLNRLNVGMPLQADSTILYVLPEHKEWLSKEDYQIDSPYNTYKYKGLPPTPICNPGIKSILAVLDAPKTDYFYFMTTKDGKAIFSKTLAEHEANLRKYYGGN